MSNTSRIISQVREGRSGQEVIQELWGGYGKVVRVADGGSTVVVKHMKVRREAPEDTFSHERKLRSYEVEHNFYVNFAPLLPRELCVVPRLLDAHISREKGVVEVLLVLEDLDAQKLNVRRHSASRDDAIVCLEWLGNFHATFLRVSADGLWEKGTYWHLGTRKKEFDCMPPGKLKDSALEIDRRLDNTQFLTILHGDAKIANFCFSAEEKRVGAVDFQYAGQGCGMKDVAYFVGSCLTSEECREREDELLNAYFRALRDAIRCRRPDLAVFSEHIERDWRGLYHVAWVDFSRFLAGWQPGHWKLHGYSSMLCDHVLGNLSQ